MQAEAVIAHLHVLRRALADYEAQIPEAALASASGRQGGRARLWALENKIRCTTFEIEAHGPARLLAERCDHDAVAAWRTQVQAMPVEAIIEGISKEQCCRHCRVGRHCVITGADPLAGPCAHPVLVGSLELDRYKENPKIRAVFAAACAKLNVRFK
jgi:hypothetical protein